MGIGLRELIVLLMIVGILLPPYAKVLHRTGFSPWFCLLLLVPVVNLIVVWVFAFIEWPIDKSRPRA